MPKYKPEWANCIRELLDAEGLSARAAERYCEGTVSHVYISDWLKGEVPEYGKALAFLEFFPNHRVKCIEASGYPLPAKWQLPQPSDPIEATEIFLKQLVPNIPEGERERVLDVLRDVIREVDAE